MISQTQRMTPTYSGPNQPARLTAKTEFMENYTIAAELAAGYEGVTVGYDQIKADAEPLTHVFVMGDDDDKTLIHYFPSLSDGTMWQKEEYLLPNNNAAHQLVTGQESNGRLIIFALTKSNNQIYYRRITDSGWSEGFNLSNDYSECNISAGQVDGQLRLAASYTADSDKSQALWIDWDHQRATLASPTYHKVYSISVGNMTPNGESSSSGGILVSRRSNSGGSSKVSFFKYNNSSTAYNYAEMSSDHYKSLAISPRAANEFVALRLDDHLHYYQGTNSSVRLFDGTKIRRFCVTLPDQDDADNAAFQVFGVTKGDGDEDHQLRYTFLDRRTSSWSDPIVLKSNTHSVAAASRNQFTNLFTVSTSSTEGVLIALQRTPGASDWRTLPISTPIPPPTDKASNGLQIAAGMDQLGTDAQPTLNLFKINSASSGHITRYIQTDALHDRWDKQSYNLPNNKKAVQIVCTQQPGGRLIIAALATNNEVFHRTAGQAQWSSYGILNVADKSGLFLAAGLQDNYPGIFVGVQRPNNQSRAYEINYDRNGAVQWGWNSDNYNKVYALASGRYTYQGTSLGGLYVSAKDESNQRFIQWYPYGNSIASPWPKYGQTTDGHYTQIQAQPSGEEGVFGLLSSNNHLYRFKGGGQRERIFSGDSIAEFVALLPPATDSQSKQQIFAITTSGKLKVITERSDGTWSGTTTIKDSATGLTGMSVLVGDNGRRSSLYDMGDKNIREYHYNDGWTSNNIKYETGEAAPATTKFASYMTQVTVGDLNELGVPMAGVYLLPNDAEVDVAINGVSYRLDPTSSPLYMVTDSRGKATCTVTATTLATPQLAIWTDFLPENDCLLVQPNGDEQTILANIDKKQLQNAKKKDGNGTKTNLFSDKSVVDDHFVQSVNDSMAMANTDPDLALQTNAKSQWLGRRSTQNTTRAIRRSEARQHGRLQNSPNLDRHFMITFGHGRRKQHRHQRLNRQQGVNQLNLMRTQLDSGNAQPFTGSFGDIMRSAIIGEISLHQVVLTRSGKSSRGFMDSVSDFFESAVSFVVDGVTYIWDGIVYLVQQAFDLVEAIFADVAVLFKDLFAWLGEFFLWGDVLNTQTFIKQFALQTLNTLPTIVQGCESYIVSALEQFTSIDLSALESSPYANTSSSVNDTAADATEEDSHSDNPQGNWLVDQFVATLNSIEFLLEFASTIESAVLQLISEMVDIIEDTIIDELRIALKALSDLVLDIQGDATFNQIIDLGLEATKEIVLRVVEALAQIVIASLDTVGQQILPALIGLLDAPIFIPLISDLYSEIINPGHDLSILDFVTLIAALPTTLGYKATMGLLGQGFIPPVIAKSSDRKSPFQISLDSDLITPLMPTNFMTTNRRSGTIILDTTRHQINIDSEVLSTINFLLGSASSLISVVTGVMTAVIDQYEVVVKQGRVAEYNATLNKITEAVTINCGRVSLILNLVNSAISYPLGWYQQDDKVTGGWQFGSWVYETVTFTVLDLSGVVVAGYYNRPQTGESTPLFGGKNAAAKTVKEAWELGIGLLTTIAGVIDGISLLGLAIMEGIDLDKNDGVAITSYAFSLGKNLLTVIDEILTVAKPFAIEAAGKVDPEDAAVAMGVIGVYDLVMAIIPPAINEGIVILQLADTVRHSQ